MTSRSARGADRERECPRRARTAAGRSASRSLTGPVDVWFVYLARCADGSIYTGITRDVAARIRAHDAGKGARYTRGRGPLVVAAVRRCMGKGEALRLELAVKALKRADKERLTVGRRLAALARRVKVHAI